MSTEHTAKRGIRPAAIGYGAVVAVVAVLVSLVPVSVGSGDTEGKMWVLYTWSLTVLPTTVALGVAMVLEYDWFSRLTSVSGRVALFVATVLAVAAIPYLVFFVILPIITRS